ncbi:MAG: phosphate ABC transporter permease PstA [Sedimentisphaerales bacterium]|nr:phosphate ABC transporter permease PstA [Sedimentisphaerales bacterium]
MNKALQSFWETMLGVWGRSALATRQIFNKVFTSSAHLSVALLVVVLLIFLVPMIRRGSTAVVFRGTNEFRELQWDLHTRGDPDDVQAETRQVEALRATFYERIDHFKRGIDINARVDEARQIYRRYGEELDQKDVTGQDKQTLRSRCRTVRNQFVEALEQTDADAALEMLDRVLAYRSDPDFRGTVVEEYFRQALDYKDIVTSIDLSRREKYAGPLEEVQNALVLLFGPRPDEPLPALTQNRYGATRWDMAQRNLHTIVYATEWVSQEEGQPLIKKEVRRDQSESQFKGTTLESWFGDLEANVEAMLKPRWTLYWQYFIDDSTPGHYFGGVGPEIIGTLLLTLLAMAFAVPLGVVSAAYLVECAGDNVVVKIIRTSVNTLAGVPSIVFGLFGLAFYILYLFPKIGLPSQKCILSASLTLAVLVLPVIIRASEEAIKSVPQTYKEASLALGAGRFRTFVTVTLPAALPGILTGIILSVSRAAGETAPIMFTGAAALGPIPESITEPTRALSYGGYDLAVGDRLAMLVPHKQYGMVMTLITLILLLNIIAIYIRSRMAKKLRGY